MRLPVTHAGAPQDQGVETLLADGREHHARGDVDAAEAC